MRNRLALALTSLLLAQPLVAQASPPTLLHPFTEPGPRLLAWLAQERAHTPAITRAQFVTLQHDALLAEARAARIVLGEGREVTIVWQSMPTVLGHARFGGHVLGDPTAAFQLALAADGLASASLQVGDETYSLRPTGIGAVHVFEQIATQLQRPCGNEPAHARSLPADPVPPQPLAAVTSVVDVLVVYTAAARASAGGKSAIESQLVLRVDNATAACKACGVDLRYRLVHLAETSYTETGTSTDLTRLRTPNDGFMDEVHGLRSTYGADLLALVIDQSSSFCGVGYLMTSLSTTFAQYAFSVTVRGCLGGHTLTHEMGHNQGCHHDRANAGNAIYPYSYGFRTSDNRYRTVMSYSPGTRINYWSSPGVQYSGYTLGVANSEDNARSLNDVRATVERFLPTSKLDWQLIPGGIPGTNGLPTLAGSGTVNQVEPIAVTLGNTRSGALGALVVGASALNLPFLGGTLVPNLDLQIAVAGNGGSVVLSAASVLVLPAGTDLWLQGFFLDPQAAQGISATHALTVRRP